MSTAPKIYDLVTESRPVPLKGSRVVSARSVDAIGEWIRVRRCAPRSGRFGEVRIGGIKFQAMPRWIRIDEPVQLTQPQLFASSCCSQWLVPASRSERRQDSNEAARGVNACCSVQTGREFRLNRRNQNAISQPTQAASSRTAPAIPAVSSATAAASSTAVQMWCFVWAILVPRKRILLLLRTHVRYSVIGAGPDGSPLSRVARDRNPVRKSGREAARKH